MNQETLFDCDVYAEADDADRVLSKNNQAGTLAEMALAKAAIQRGYTVFFPIGHSTKADLILHKNSRKPITVQVKKAAYQKEGGSFKAMIGAGRPSCSANPKNYGLRYTRYAAGDFDIMAIYIAEIDKFYFFELREKAGISTINIRPDIHTMDNWQVIDDYR
jgi:hypothetical protein